MFSTPEIARESPVAIFNKLSIPLLRRPALRTYASMTFAIPSRRDRFRREWISTLSRNLEGGRTSPWSCGMLITILKVSGPEWKLSIGSMENLAQYEEKGVTTSV
jgi:hypothetical protein